MTFNPTPEQIEAAAKVMARAHGVRFDVVPEWLEPYKGDARKVLEAVAAVAAQEPGDRAELAREVLELAGKRRDKGDQYAGYPEYVGFSDRYYAEAEVMRQASVALTTPLQVDEAKLAEVISTTIRALWEVWENRTQQSEDIAHDVAEWLRGGAQ